MTKRNIPLERIVAYDNSSGALSLLQKYNLSARTHQDIEAGLKNIITQDRENGFLAVADLHPDKEMILDLFSDEKTSGFCAACNFDGKKDLNCDGPCSCGGKCGGKKLSADGDGSTLSKSDVSNMIAQATNKTNDTHTLLFGGVILITLAVLLKN